MSSVKEKTGGRNGVNDERKAGSNKGSFIKVSEGNKKTKRSHAQ
ncbi:MAG: hypothetical protein WA104_01175 [Thermodesulfovibrionales bacterium]